jgi:hypothetical protein
LLSQAGIARPECHSASAHWPSPPVDQACAPAFVPAAHLCAAAISKSCASGALEESAMKKLLVAAVIAGSIISFEARAQERAGSAALGAVSGAVVLGPVGAVAGALIGYTAGPAIAHSWGVGHSAPRSRVRRTAQSGPEQPAATRVTPPPVGPETPPPVGKTPETPPPLAKAPQTVAITKNAPPVQGFE